MKKLFLVVIGLILMAGATFSPSKSRSFVPDSEVSFLSEHVPGDLCMLNNKITQATQKFSAFKSQKLINYNYVIPALQLAIHEQLEVCSSNTSLFTDLIVNTKSDLTDNGIYRKRVNILLC